MYLLAAAVALPLAYFMVSWSLSTYTFLAMYQPEQLFQQNEDPATPREAGTEILEALNAEIEQESYVKQSEEKGLLALVDRLWHSVRRYVAPSSSRKPRDEVLARASVPQQKSSSFPFAGQPHGRKQKPEDTPDVLSLAADPEVLETASSKNLISAKASPETYKTLLNDVAAKAAFEALEEDEGEAAAEWLYRFESLKGLRTQSLIYQFNRNLALEGTVEAAPVVETDPDLTDFGFRTVHALNFLRDRPAPSLASGYDGVHSGYPLSYGIGVNYQVSPLVNLRFDYSYETPIDYLVEYNGTWESSLMTNFEKGRSDNPLSVHSFFFGFRYLYQQKAVRFPLHTGFFYSTNMEDEPLDSNVSMGFSMGAGIHKRDLRLGFAWRFRVWDEPEQRFLYEEGMREAETRVTNQFLFTLLF